VSATGAGTVQDSTADGTAQDQSSFDYVMIFRYVLAAAVALAAIVIALRSFGGTLSQSIISVGRNPLARGTILSMMLWNTFLIFLVSGAGLAIGVAILFFP
jgi:hypothetical protein